MSNHIGIFCDAAYHVLMAAEDSGTVQIAVRFPRALLARAEEYAAAQPLKSNRSQVIVAALEEYLARHQPAPAKPKGK